MTIATIFSTASFRLWQKLTSALPLGPILPNIMPAQKWSAICKCEIQSKNMNTYVICCSILTHGGREDDNPQDVHALTGARERSHHHVRRRGQIQLKVLDVRPVIVLNPVDERAASGALHQTGGHCRLGLHYRHTVEHVFNVPWNDMREKHEGFLTVWDPGEHQRSSWWVSRCPLNLLSVPFHLDGWSTPWRFPPPQRGRWSTGSRRPWWGPAGWNILHPEPPDRTSNWRRADRDIFNRLELDNDTLVFCRAALLLIWLFHNWLILLHWHCYWTEFNQHWTDSKWMNNGTIAFCRAAAEMNPVIFL